MAERRADLELVNASFPEYVAPQVLPFLPVNQSAGRVYYMDYTADITADYNRSTGELAAITSNAIAATDYVFGTKEVRARVALGYDQIKGYSDLNAAEISMARIAKRSYFNKIESLTAAALLNDENAVDGSENIVTAIDTAVAGLRDKGLGKVAIVMSYHNFAALKNDATVKARMTNTGVIVADSARYVGADQMAAIFGADAVILGADAIWYAAGLTGKDCIAVVCLPDETFLPAEQIQLGRVINFAFDGNDDKFIIERYHDDASDAEVCDAKGLVDVAILNAELKTTISLVSLDDDDDDESNLGNL